MTTRPIDFSPKWPAAFRSRHHLHDIESKPPCQELAFRARLAASPGNWTSALNAIFFQPQFRSSATDIAAISGSREEP